MLRRLGKARERLLEATGEYAFPPGGQLDEITGLRKQTRVRDLQFKVLKGNTIYTGVFGCALMGKVRTTLCAV